MSAPLPAPVPAPDPPAPTIALAVPGRWGTRGHLAKRILHMSNQQFVFFGGDLIRVNDMKIFACDVIEHDAEVAESFRIASRGRIAPEDIEEIGQHTYTVYVRGDGGSMDAARDMMDAATALIAAGGLAVKVESAGLAHSSVEWLQRADPTQPAGLYWAYVALIKGRGDRSYSCGMHAFGMRDAITEIIWEREMLAAMMHNFLGLSFIGLMQLHEDAQFEDPSEIKYRIRGEPCTTFPAGTVQHNPYGLWRLELVE